MGSCCSKQESASKLSDEKACKKCAECVTKALDGCEVIEPKDHDYSSCFIHEGIGEELTLDFSNVTLDDLPEQDQSGKKDDGKSGDHDVEGNRIVWSQERRKEFAYTPTSDTFSDITEHKMDVSDTSKRLIVALSDLHLGGHWAEGMDEKLRNYLDMLITTATEKLACVVLLGDVFEMWLDKFWEVPPSNEDRVNSWRECSTVLIEAVDRLVNECDVKVFYVRGNHDGAIQESDVNSIFDGNVTFIPSTLVLTLKTSENSDHRIRFCHGHQYDLFNSSVLNKSDHLIADRPIGYYVARAVGSSSPHKMEVEELLKKIALKILRAIPKHLENNVMDAFLKNGHEKKLLGRIFEGALEIGDLKKMEDAIIRVSEVKWIRLKTLLDYPVLRLLAAQVGKQDAFHMLKAATGDYRKFVKRMEEDVVIMGHTHQADIWKYRNYLDNQVIYANTGSWTAQEKEFSSITIKPPTGDEDGEIHIKSATNK